MYANVFFVLLKNKNKVKSLEGNNIKESQMILKHNKGTIGGFAFITVVRDRYICTGICEGHACLQF